MARPSTKDPLDKFRFQVSILGMKEKLAFTTFETPSYAIRTNEYAEGGDHLHPKQIVDSISYGQISLTRGVTSGVSFIEWALKPMERVSYNTPPEVQTGFRRTVTIQHLNRKGEVVKTYILYNCIPVEFKPGSDFDASADDGVSLEKLTLKYESFEVISKDQKRNFLNVQDVVKRLIRNF